MSSPADPEPVDIAIVGAGAAGLFCALHAARSAPGARIVALDGAKKLGAKILVAGGGRCNVTHHVVSEGRYFGSSRNSIRNVLRRFPVEATVAFFSEMGVDLKQEETGKLFPTTDSARTILDALLRAANNAGAELRHPWRVRSIVSEISGFLIHSENGDAIRARRVVLAAGGRSLPKSGSDGAGEKLARSLGLPITERVFPALVPLVLPQNHFLCSLSGLSFEGELSVFSSTGKRLESEEGAILCTHFGLSGPCAMNISRVFLNARLDDPAARLTLSVSRDSTDELDKLLVSLSDQTPLTLFFRSGPPLPERLVLALSAHAGVEPRKTCSHLTREQRRRLAEAFTALALPIEGPRGWNYAEVTAGGVPLSAIAIKTMESRDCPQLHLCGEVCDVDGRIGGFNFQWAWSSGYVAGISAAKALDVSL